jgi:hypothetical protein
LLYLCLWAGATASCVFALLGGKGNDHASEFGLFHCTPLCSSSNSLSCLWRIWTVSSYFSIPKRASPARQLLLPLVEPCVISLEHGALNAVQIEWR